MAKALCRDTRAFFSSMKEGGEEAIYRSAFYFLVICGQISTFVEVVQWG
jgi:hypothetical protein